jgi:hypothetical protein
MTIMALQGPNIPQPQRRQAKCTAATGRGSGSGPHVASTAQPAEPTRLPPRPGPNILSEAIPLFFIGRNKDGFWVAREADGRIGGIFLCKQSALRFANRSTQPGGCATMFLSECFELDVENKGNPLVAHLCAAMRLVPHLAQRLTASAGKMAEAARPLFTRFARALADKRRHWAAIERELFRGRYKHSSKNDDDVPIVR